MPTKQPPSDTNPAHYRQTGNGYENILTGDYISNRQYIQHVSETRGPRRYGMSIDEYARFNTEMENNRQGMSTSKHGWEREQFQVPDRYKSKVTGMPDMKLITDWIKKNLPPDVQVQVIAKGKKKYPSKTDIGTVIRAVDAEDMDDDMWNEDNRALSQFDEINEFTVMWRD